MAEAKTTPLSKNMWLMQILQIGQMQMQMQG